MTLDDGRKAEKAAEIVGLLRQALHTHARSADDAAATALFDHYVDMTAPEAPPTSFIRVYEGGDGGGRSTKPGNVRLNMRKLFVAAATGALTLAGATVAPWTVILGGLVVWESLYSATEIELGDVEAAVLWALWLNRDAADTVPHARVLELVNAELRKLDRPELTAGQVSAAIARLKQLDCIEPAKEAPDRWRLREWVQIEYR
jgi:hypothetical protein